MAQMLITAMYQPGTTHISSLMSRAERMLEHKVIKALPTITVKKASIEPLWHFIINCTEEDRLAWLAFYEGCDMCINNRSIMVGCE